MSLKKMSTFLIVKIINKIIVPMLRYSTHLLYSAMAYTYGLSLPQTLMGILNGWWIEL